MSEKVYIQYLGFRCEMSGREYAFRVLVVPVPSQVAGNGAEGTQASHDAGVAIPAEWREFTLTIPHEAFISHRARYQDAADICSLKLHRELTAFANDPPVTHYRISDAELAEYHHAHAPKPTHSTYSPKPPQDL